MASSRHHGYALLDQEDPEPPVSNHRPAITGSPSARYARVSMLVMDEGSEAVKRKVLENLPGDQTLEDTLYLKCQQMQSLVDKGILNMTQIDVLYPESEDPISKKGIDLTLWVILLRHITTNAKSINKKWTEDPQPFQRQYWHDIQRLKKIRNKLAHNGKAELEEESFWEIWQEATMVLFRLDVPASTITSYLERDLDPERATKVVQEVKDQFLNDLNALLTQSKKQTRKLKIMFIVIAAVIIILVTASVIVPFFVIHPTGPCADNIQYARTKNAMVGYLSREGWGAHKRPPMNHLQLPVKYILISHTSQVTTPCSTTEDCCATLRAIQRLSINGTDIYYNFVIGGDGLVFEGRGSNFKAASPPRWSSRSVKIGFIGEFMRRPPSDSAVDALHIYLDFLVMTNVTTEDYILYGLCQVDTNHPRAPGGALLKVLMKSFSNHWGKDNITHCAMNDSQLLM